MKVFVVLLLSIIFPILIISCVPSFAEGESTDNNVVSEDPKYQVYLQVVVRNAHDELVSVTDAIPCQSGRNCAIYMPHEVTDYAFDTLLGKKEIITIDNIKYEKVQFSTSSDNQMLFDTYDREYTGIWEVEICGESIKKYGFNCANLFWVRTGLVFLEVDDITTANWTILREMN